MSCTFVTSLQPTHDSVGLGPIRLLTAATGFWKSIDFWQWGSLSGDWISTIVQSLVSTRLSDSAAGLRRLLPKRAAVQIEIGRENYVR